MWAIVAIVGLHLLHIQGMTFMVSNMALGYLVKQRNQGVQVHSSIQVERVVKKDVDTLAFTSHGIIKVRILC